MTLLAEAGADPIQDTPPPDQRAYLRNRIHVLVQNHERQRIRQGVALGLGVLSMLQAFGLYTGEYGDRVSGPPILRQLPNLVPAEPAAAAETDPPPLTEAERAKAMRAVLKANPGPTCESPRESGIQWLVGPVARFHPFAVAAAEAHNLPDNLIEVFETFESLGHPSVVSEAGAVGLGQVLPSTAAGLAAERGLPMPDLKNPKQNLDYTAFYLRRLLDHSVREPAGPLDRRTVYELAVAYHGGPGTLVRYYDGRQIGPRTSNYAEHVALAWDERGAETSSAQNDWLSHTKARELLASAAAIPIDDCTLLVK